MKVMDLIIINGTKKVYTVSRRPVFLSLVRSTKFIFPK